MTLCFPLHRAVGGNKDERPYVNRLGNRRVPAQMQVLAAGVSQAASWRRPRTTPNAALQPHASLALADPRPPRFPRACRQGGLCGGHGLGSRARMEARVGWCARGPSPGAGVHWASIGAQRLPRKQVQRAPGGNTMGLPCSHVLAMLAGQSQEGSCVSSTNISFSLLFV